jgi:hypothetical protein
MTAAPKVVVSTTLDHPDWGPTTLISGDVAAELTKLKQRTEPARAPPLAAQHAWDDEPDAYPHGEKERPASNAGDRAGSGKLVP